MYKQLAGAMQILTKIAIAVHICICTVTYMFTFMALPYLRSLMTPELLLF